ncbi:MAG: MarR family transcriptional regulator [Thermoplasmataceae archaeon]
MIKETNKDGTVKNQKAENKSVQASYGFKLLILHAISLVTSILIITVSTSIFVTVIFIRGAVSASFFYLFIAIITSNIVVSAFSLRGMVRIYSILFQKRFTYINDEVRKSTQQTFDKPEFKREFFSNAELEIIDMLKDNSNRMLQSAIVAATSMSKTTISRTLTSLEEKGIIIKIRKGVTNEIILDETYSR